MSNDLEQQEQSGLSSQQGLIKANQSGRTGDTVGGRSGHILSTGVRPRMWKH